MDYQGGGDNNNNAYGSGGGFNSGGGAGGDFGASQSPGGAGGGQRRNYDEQTCIPVTARMILASQPDLNDNTQLKLEDDRKLYHIKLVGAVRGVEQTSTAVVYQLEDGTGLVDVKQWLDETDCTALQELRAAAQQDHIYVKVVGQLKMYNGSKQILASSVRPVSTGNEIAHHFLEVVYSGEKYKNDSTIVQPTSPMMMTGNSSGAYGSVGGVGFGGSGPSGGGGRTPLMQQAGGGGSGDALRDSVLAFIQQNGGTYDNILLVVAVCCQFLLWKYRSHLLFPLLDSTEASEYGANVEECVKRLGHGSEAEVRQAIGNLESEGVIYSTVNQDNYKCA